jgi:hypothetical protein
MPPSTLRTIRFWLGACIVGTVLWVSCLILGEHLPFQPLTIINVLHVAGAIVGGVLWVTGGWRTIEGLQRSGIPLLPSGKAAVFALGSTAILQQLWIIVVLLAPAWISARVLAETNLLIGSTLTLIGIVSWNTPRRTEREDRAP